jgi:ABC-type transporter Mla subunit MlaD
VHSGLVVLTLVVLWKLFEKQHDFIKERVELLRQENEDLRKQIQIFREENERLRNTSSMIVRAVDQLQSQPILGQKQLEELYGVSEAIKKAVEQNLPASRALIESTQSVTHELRKIAELNELSIVNQSQMIDNLQRAIKRRASDEDILMIVQQLIRIVGQSQRQLGESVSNLEQQTEALLSQKDFDL